MSKIQANQIQHTANGAVTFTLPQTDGSAGQVLMTDGSGNLSWVSLPTGGLSMAQQWKTTSHQTLSTSYVTLNTWQAVGHTGAGSIGTGLTHNSGTFSFPSTGIYHLSAIGTFQDASNNQDFLNLGFNVSTHNISELSTEADSYFFKIEVEKIE